MRARFFVFFTTVLFVGELAFAVRALSGWVREGVSVCQDHCGTGPSIAPDGAGGAHVVWRHYPPGSAGSNANVYMQRLTSAGEIAPGWPAGDLAVCTDPASQQPGGIATDGGGGLFVTWYDFRNVVPGGSGPDIYAQRIRADGTIAPGWAANGMPVTRAPGYQSFSVVVADGIGGAYVTWIEDEQAPDIYLQHLTAGGVPAPGWPADGLPICLLPGFQGGPQLVPDGVGGVIIAWGDLRDGSIANYAQRVTADGLTLWAENGVLLVRGPAIRDLAPDGSGGAYLSCSTFGPYFDEFHFLQRFTGAGEIAPGWPANGVPVCAVPGERGSPWMVPDGAGGVLLAWYDYREPYDSEVFVQRVRPDGTLAPGWPVDGLQLTHNTDADFFPDLAPDGAGGAYVCWGRAPPGGDDRVVVQHVTAVGQVAAGWPADGAVMPGTQTQSHPQIATDGQGGAIVTWEHQLGDDVRGQRFVADGSVSVEVSLVSAAATPEQVVLVWALSQGAGMATRVERRTVNDDWQRIGNAVADGANRVRYEDRAVTPGRRYAYRLSWEEDGATRSSAETWVEVPAVLALFLEGLRPNPALRDLNVAFTLPSAETAQLELLDVGGRRVLAREVGGLGAGRHLLRLGERGETPPGLYWLRLTQAGRSLLARAVVIR